LRIREAQDVIHYRWKACGKKLLTDSGVRLTMYYMKTATLTIRLDKELEELLSKASRRTGKNRSEIAREALRRQIRLETFEELRKRIMPFAEARGYLTDEDIFSKVS
jgi:predicted transcriptional regulator